jgi:hypothetical protein
MPQKTHNHNFDGALTRIVTDFETVAGKAPPTANPAVAP